MNDWFREAAIRGGDTSCITCRGCPPREEPSESESSCAVRGSQSGGPIEAGNCRAEIRDGASAIGSRSYIMKIRGVPVRVTAMIHSSVIYSIYSCNNRRGDTRAPEYEPRGTIATTARAKHGNAGVGIGNGGNVSDRALRTARVLLPGWLRIHGAATTAGARPRRLCKAAGRPGGALLARASYSRHVR